ncbi:probable RNA helicase armi [Athalia rosae]|uniref:probable RNA helicase armi n=1 Tax=Athalia rosae TaxID=37344 RepID=UPI002034463C|nr:probable RNA helicase armi [Athalia rosae]
MVSLIYNALKRVLTFSQEPEPDLADVIQQLENEQEQSLDACLEQELNEDLEGCFHKTGTITQIESDYLVVDEKYVCEKSRINQVNGNIKIGAKIYYLGFRRSKNDEIKVVKILSVNTDDWNNEGTTCDKKVVRSDTLSRVIVGKVIKRELRMVYVEPNQITFSLDEVTSEFIPVIGDWLKIESVVQVDDNFVDYSGEILHVDRIFPLRSKIFTGVVTVYNINSGIGTINNNVAFNKIDCEPGYIPFVGDRVITDCIESDQGKNTWRSLSIVPIVQQAGKQPILNTQVSACDDSDQRGILKEEKYGVMITSNLTYDLQLLEKRDIIVEIKNNGQHKQTITNGLFLSKKSMSQLILVYPNINSTIELNPSESISYTFRCHAKFIGYSEEAFLFVFKHFRVRRMFRFNVSLKNSSRHEIKTDQSVKVNKLYKQTDKENSKYVVGVRPSLPPRFIAVRPGIFNIPQRLWDVVLRLQNEKKPLMESVMALEEMEPLLSSKLNFKNFKDRFHMLLYLESIGDSIEMQRYDMSGVFMRPTKEFLALKVPGLAEKRPSLVVGDKAIISFNWDDSQGNLIYEGFVHQVKSSEVLLKFNPAFHEKYNGARCEVTFKCSLTPSNRCHTAVNLSILHLGPEFLFPSKIVPKAPQLDLLELDSEREGGQSNNVFMEKNVTAGTPKNSDLEECALQLKKRKLVWFNKKLNRYQKEAVRNILQAKARPLPYVIFGPPGTGKTITLCETILQTFKIIPESRLLVATPSNSSANLITERLLDSGVLKPGDLVRLVGFHCIVDNSIPEKLLPYCAVGDISREGTSIHSQSQGDGIKLGCSTSVLGRHRITVGTCISLGILYNMGFPRGHFSHVFVDEAGQATEPEILIPLNFIHSDHGQVILAGDPMQLGPVVRSRYADHFGLGLSFLSRLLQRFPYQKDTQGFEWGYDPRLVTKLRMNYRSLPEILHLPNLLFYDSELEPQITRQGKEGDLLNLVASDLPERSTCPPAIVFHGVLGQNYQDPDSPSWYNPEEAAQVYFYVLKLQSHGVQSEDIGIIAPYTKQVHQIRDLLSEMDMTLPKIGSVEEFQGQERNVIILSTVRSISDLVQEDVKRCLGFISLPRRLNVAITRARALLIILGNPYLLSQDLYWSTVISYCVQQNSYTGCDFLSSSSDAE